MIDFLNIDEGLFEVDIFLAMPRTEAHRRNILEAGVAGPRRRSNRSVAMRRLEEHLSRRME
jgi:hypothetical protein